MVGNSDSGYTGALNRLSSTLTGVDLNLGSAGTSSFDASRVSSIYGSSETVTPRSLSTLMLIKF